MSLTSRLAGFFSQDSSRRASSEAERNGDPEPGLEPESALRNKRLRTMEILAEEETDIELKRPPYIHVCLESLWLFMFCWCVQVADKTQSMLAGGIGGTTGDILMHSLDTVKTRQQGDPHFPPKYSSLTDSYVKIFRQEGIRRGLYGGFTAAMLGSFPGTVIFFGAYEYCKRHMLDRGMTPSVAYLTSGMDLFALTQRFRSEANRSIKGSLPIWQHPSFMCHPKSSRLACNCKVDTTTPSSIRDTTTSPRGMQPGQSSALKDSTPYTLATKLRSSGTCRFQRSNSPSMSKRGNWHSSGAELKTLALGLKCSPQFPLVVSLES